MAAVVDTDYSIAANGDIRYTGTTTNNTVIEFHRWLQDKADDAIASGNDLLDITSSTPSERSTDNIITLNAPYNIDDTVAEHLFDGSITQDSGDTVYSGLVVVGSVESGTNLQIVQDGALLTSYWGSGLNADAAANILLRIMVKTRVNGADIDGKRLRVQARELGDTYAEFSLTAGLGNSTAAIFTSSDLNNQTAAGTISGWTSIVNTEGLPASRHQRRHGQRGVLLPWDLGTQSINDLYERTKWIQRRATSETIHGINGELFRGITHQIAYDGEASGPFTEDEVVVWGTSFNYDNEASGPFSLGEYLSFGTSGAVGKLIQLTDSGATGSMVVAIESGSGTVVDNDPITGLTSGATADINGTPNDTGVTGGEGILLALDDDGATGNLYIQLTSGGAPVDNLQMRGRTSGATADCNGSPTARTVSPAFIGASTGSAIIGAYGIGIQPADLTASDQLFDLSNTLRVPPNNVTFTVGGLVSGEDRVLVGPESAGNLEVSQLSLNTTLSGVSETAIVVTASIPTDTPSTGTVRVELDSGIYRRVAYTSYTGSTFTIASTDFSSDNATSTNNVFISYIDELAGSSQASFTGVYASDRSLFIRVRDGGASPIKTFETTGTLGSAGGSTTAIRTSDA